jgi:translation initiation factor 2B subunit (eIF-2B alpha/beta/delta family)
VDRILRRQLDSIARDNHSGASELAKRTIEGIQDCLKRHPKMASREFTEIASSLLRVQPAMAPLWRIANEIAWSLDYAKPRRYLQRSLAATGTSLVTSPAKVAKLFFRALPPSPRKAYVMTYSYSSTVLRALIESRSRIRVVYCSEGRPGYEGRIMATRLAKAGIQTVLRTDAEHFQKAPILASHLVIGADKVLLGGFENKTGTQALVKLCQGRPRSIHMWVLADTTKFWPEPLNPLRSLFWRSVSGRLTDVWKAPPRNVITMNYPFWFVGFTKQMRVLTEQGWMTPEQVRREIAKIRLSPRLKEIARLTRNASLA